MSEWIVIWKDSPGYRVSTVVDAMNRPVVRDDDYVHAQNLTACTEKSHLLSILKEANGVKVAITPELVSSVLGWEV